MKYNLDVMASKKLTGNFFWYIVGNGTDNITFDFLGDIGIAI